MFSGAKHCVLAATICGAFLLVGCSEGGNSIGKSEATISYIGSTTPAVVNSDNAIEVATAAFLGVSADQDPKKPGIQFNQEKIDRSIVHTTILALNDAFSNIDFYTAFSKLE